MSSLEYVNEQKSRFLEWVNKYKVYKTYAQDAFEPTTEQLPFVWTEFQGDDETFIDIGYTEYSDSHRMPVVGYYLSEIPNTNAAGSYEIVLTSTLLDCDACEAMGEDEDGEECSVCFGERGNYVDFDELLGKSS